MRAKAGPLVLVVIVAVAVSTLVVGRAVLRDDPPCGALTAPVAELDGFAWGNGVTSSGSEWLSVLTDGVTEADAASRSGIAEVVAADDAGFERFRSALPDDLHPVADRLRAVALDPDSERTGRSVEPDARALRRHGFTSCGLV